MGTREQEEGSSPGQGLRKPPQEMKALRTPSLGCSQDPSPGEEGSEHWAPSPTIFI